MNELITKLLSGQGKISLLLLEAREYIEQEGDLELLGYVNLELNGYKGKELPNYRKLKGKIEGSIQDPFGEIENNIPIDTSKISEQLGYDIATARIHEGIGYIEESLEHISGSRVTRALPEKMVEKINELIQNDDSDITLISAHHSFGKSGLQYIPNKVREELIKGLQNLKKNTLKKHSRTKKVEDSNDEINVFISYAWEDEEHNDKIISFVDFLRKNGYNASMDKMKSQEETATNFNKMMITGLQDANKVVVVLSPKYKEKANTFQGGVGTEFQIIVEEIKTMVNKFIFVSFGINSIEDIVPTGIRGREVLDLKKDQDEEGFNGLFGKLKSQNTIRFSEVEKTTKEIKVKDIKPFKL